MGFSWRISGLSGLRSLGVDGLRVSGSGFGGELRLRALGFLALGFRLRALRNVQGLRFERVIVRVFRDCSML